jgi:hypothetical protein
LSDTAALPIGAVDRINGLTRFTHWRAVGPVSGVAEQPALQPRKHATAEALDAVLDLRGYVEELQAVELPKGFGRD